MFSPVAGSRLKHTPVAESSPELPNTIAWTLTAVPQSPGILFNLRYVIAFLDIQEPNTAPIPNFNCSHGSCGKTLPIFTPISLNCSTNCFKSSAVNSVSTLYPLLSFICSSVCSNKSISAPNTTSLNIIIKRRYESYANLSLFAARANAFTVSSFKPKFKTVSIIPGIDTRAPERTDTNNGFSLSANFLPIIDSMCAIPDFTWSIRSDGYC